MSQKDMATTLISDNEYYLLLEIAADNKISQRALSKKLGVSLGAVNTLIAKMVKEGVIKIEQISGRQVAYRLTPAGVNKKAKKTVSYLKGHYQALFESKEKIKTIIDDLAQEYTVIYIIINNDELGAVTEVALKEINSKQYETSLVLISSVQEIQESEKNKDYVVINATENDIDKNLIRDGIKIVKIVRQL